MIEQVSQGELAVNRNLTLTTRGQARLILVCGTKTSCENMAYPSFRSEGGAVNGVSCQSLSSLSPVSLSLSGAFWDAAASTPPPIDVVNYLYVVS